MGGEGSGNEGKKKFGDKYYNYRGSYSTGRRAAKSANQYNDAGIPARVKKERRETDYPPHEERVGYSVYTHSYAPRKKRNEPASGTRHYF